MSDGQRWVLISDDTHELLLRAHKPPDGTSAQWLASTLYAIADEYVALNRNTGSPASKPSRTPSTDNE